MRCVLAFILALVGLLTIAGAAPTVSTPLASQLPPVARVGEDFVFSILPGSFKSNSTTSLNYTANSLPAWLQFVPSNPTFYGQPTANDVGEHVVTLAATDSTGTANSSFTVIVSNYASPYVNMDFDKQLADPKSRDIASASVMPGNHGVSVPPYWSFALGWNGNTFKRPNSKGNGNLYYSAHLRGETGLPEWLQFSNTTFTFNGVSPSNGTYEVVVVGTDYWNYTAASSTFVLSVGTGAAVENSKAWTGIKTVTRTYIEYPLDLSGMLLDGKTLDPTRVKVSPDLSDVKWLSFNNTTNTIIGTTPDNLLNGTVSPYNIPVTLSSTNNSNTLSYVSYLNVSVLPYAFSTFQLPTNNVVAGQTFQYDVSQYLVNKSSSAEISASVIPGVAASWLLFHPDNNTLVGTPPANITYSAINVTFESTLDNVTSTTNVTMPIEGVTGPEGEGEPAPIPNANKKSGLSTKNKIIIGVVVGVVGLLALLALLLCCCLRKRKSRTNDKTISKPMALAAKEGSPDTLTNTPNGKKSLMDGKSVDGDSPEKTGERRFGIRGLFGTVDEPTLPSHNSKGTSYYSGQASPNGSFVGSGELIAVGDPNDTTLQSGITRSANSMGSIASWESMPSVHWSGENEYLEPLYERDGFDALTPPMDQIAPSPTTDVASTNIATPILGAGAAAAAAVAASASRGANRNVSDSTYVPGRDDDIPRPRPGFNPSYPRWVKKGDKVPALSSDNVSLYFSEFDRENSDRDMTGSRSLTTSRSLDSFAGQGSEIVGTSSSSRFGSRPSQSGEDSAWWKTSNLSSGLGHSASSYSVGEAVVSTAQRQSLDTQRSSIVPNEVIDFTAGHSPAMGSVATPTTPTRPVSYLVVPSYVPQVYTPPKNPPSRRQSSSRRSPAAVVPTRELIMRGEPQQGEILYSAPLDDGRHAL